MSPKINSTWLGDIMEEYKYTVIIEPAEEGGYLARVPALDDLTTEGDTLDEVKYMVQDAIKGYIETLRAEQLPIPKDFKEQPRVQQFAVSV